jgi:hypothetical protein
MSRNLSGSIDLSKLVSKVIKTKAGGTAIVISVEKNHCVVGEKGIYLNLGIRLHDEPDKYEQDGFISHKVDSKTYKAASEEQKESFKELPILGNIKDFGGGASNDKIEAAVVVSDDGEFSDLPF